MIRLGSLHRLGRFVLGLASLALAGVLVVPYLAIGRERDRLVGILAEHHLTERQPDVVPALRREPDPYHARVLAARALLADALDSSLYAQVPSVEQREALLRSRVAGLALAQQLSREALAHRPASWQGWLILGGALYLERSILRDRALITRPRDWEAPLERSLELAPGQSEARRFLTMAYLEVWNSLSEEKQARTRSMLTESFRDPQTFSRMIGPWMEVAGSLDEALALLPEEPFVWESVLELLRRDGDWRRYCTVFGKWDAALRQELSHRLDEGLARLEGGDLRRGRDQVLYVLSRIPPDLSWSGQVERAFSSLPPGQVTRDQAERLRLWLEWELDRCLYGQCALPPTVTARMAGAISDLQPDRAARAQLAAGDLARAELFERQAQGVWAPEWGPYLLQKIPHLLARHEVPAARRALSQIHPQWQDSPLYQLARRDVAQAAGDERELEAARAALDRLPHQAWSRTDWRLHSPGVFRLEVYSRRGSGVIVRWDEIAPSGSAVELIADGRSLRAYAVLPEHQVLEVELGLEAGLHLFELRILAGGNTVPGPVELH